MRMSAELALRTRRQEKWIQFPVGFSNTAEKRLRMRGNKKRWRGI
jgi:hypothetical protein